MARSSSPPSYVNWILNLRVLKSATVSSAGHALEDTAFQCLHSDLQLLWRPKFRNQGLVDLSKAKLDGTTSCNLCFCPREHSSAVWKSINAGLIALLGQPLVANSSGPHVHTVQAAVVVGHCYSATKISLGSQSSCSTKRDRHLARFSGSCTTALVLSSFSPLSTITRSMAP